MLAVQLAQKPWPQGCSCRIIVYILHLIIVKKHQRIATRSYDATHSLNLSHIKDKSENHMSLRAAVAACVLLHAELVLSQTQAIGTAARNADDLTAWIIAGVFGFVVLLCLFGWLSGQLTCKEISQMLN